MGKLKDFFTNDHIQSALVSGLCIIALAYYFKKILHIPVPAIENAVPGLIFTGYQLVKAKKVTGIFSKVWVWNLIMVLATALLMLRYQL